MKQQVMIAPGTIEIREVDRPVLDNHQVLIKMMRIGICGSDIHVFHGNHPLTSYPVTQGHEVSGQVVAVGSDVDHLSKGDKVTVQPQQVCQSCYSCRHGNYHICDNLKVMGFQTTGLASQYVAVDANLVLKLPATFSYEQGAMVEPLAIACSALRKADGVLDKDIVVLGAGPIGHLVGQTAKALGARSVMITDISSHRLQLASDVGLDYPINPTLQSLSQAIEESYGAARADLIIECVGSNRTIDDAIANARKGTAIILVGVFGEKLTLDISTVQDHELRLIGLLMYQKQDFLQAIDLIDRGKVNLEPLMSAHFSLDEYQSAYQFLDNQKDEVMKVFIDIH